MEIKSVVAANIKGFRTLQGYSREEFCTLTGLHLNYLGAIERGEKNLTIETLNKIAIVLGVDPFVFFIPKSFHWLKQKA